MDVQELVSYSVETFYNEPADFAQLVAKRFIKSSSGLFAPCANEPVFVAININGEPLPREAMVRGTPTVFGFFVPTTLEVELLRQEPADRQFLTLIASNGAELSDQVVTSLDWAKHHIRSLEGHQIIGGPCGVPNPDPAAAEIVLQACRRWANDTEIDLDNELLQLLEGSGEADDE